MRAHAVKREKREKNELAARYRSKTLARLSLTTSENYESYFVTLSWLSYTQQRRKIYGNRSNVVLLRFLVTEHHKRRRK